MGKQKYTDEFLISELKRFVDENGRNPTYNDMCVKNGYPSSVTYANCFGTWSNALKLADLTPNHINYTKEFLLNEIHRFHYENNRIPKYNDMKAKNGYPSGDTYAVHFGSWNNAIKEAGFKANEVIRYSEEFLLNEIYRFVNEHGRSPTASDFKPLSGYPSNTTYQRVFGSWNNALKLANVSINQMGTYSDEFLLDELHRYVNEYHKNPTYDSMVELKNYPSARVYEVHFGSWNDALKAAGLDVNVITDYSETFLIDELKRFYKENNRSPAMSDFNNSDYPSVSTYVRRFGTWNKALELANLDLNDIPYTKEELVNKILEFYKKYNKVPTTIDFDNNNDYPSYGTYRRYFNNWDEALECAGLYKDDFLYSDEFLLSELHRFIEEYDKTPTRDDFAYNNEYPSGGIYYYRFGTWNNALELANIPLNKVNKYTEDELIEYIHKFIELYKHVPTIDEMNSHNDFPSSMTYMNTFGSWNNALEIANVSINKFTFDYNTEIKCDKCGKILKSNAMRNQIGMVCCRSCYDYMWKKLNPEKAYLRSKRHHEYGFIPLNNKFEGSEGHHLHLEHNSKFSIFIPNFLHKLHHHSSKNEESMITTNAIALDFLIQEEMYSKLYLTGDV